MKKRLPTTSLIGKPSLAVGGTQVGHATVPAASPTPTNPRINNTLITTRTFCARADRCRPIACTAVSPTTNTTATSFGGVPGITVSRYAPAPSASTAIGAEKPTSSEPQPAR